MNTALGNCLIMCAAVYGLCAKLNMISKLRPRVSLFNNGDDCVVIGERGDVMALATHVPSFFGELGLVMKVEPIVDTLEHVSFCQTNPVFDGVKWRMCRDPRVCMSKDLYVLDRVCAMNHLSAQSYAIGECGLSLAGGLPVLQEFYAALMRNGRRGKAVDKNFHNSGFKQLAHGMTEKYQPVTDAARVSFWRAFGVVPDLQCAWEQMYSTASYHMGRPCDDQPWEMPI